MFATEVQNFFSLDIWSMLANLTQDSSTISGLYVIFRYIEILWQGGIKWKQVESIFWYEVLCDISFHRWGTKYFLYWNADGC